jgi:phosphoadenosine phosphosulfate reductase
VRALDKAGFTAHAMTRCFSSRVCKSEGLITEALAEHGPWCISFSGGKDSTVLLDLVSRQCPGAPVVWMDDGWDFPETLMFLTETEQRIGRHILRIAVPVRSPYWRDVPYPGDDPAFGHPSDMDFDAWCASFSSFVGVRAEESGDRSMMLRHYGTLFHNKTWGHWNCYPLAYWDTEDIWAYIASRDLPYNPVYDKLEELGVPLKYRRVGPLTAYMAWRYGWMVTVRRGWPELYNRFAAALPQIERLT